MNGRRGLNVTDPAVQDARDDAQKWREQAVRLLAENERLDRAVNEEIAERDRLHELLDQIAFAIAPQRVIGEHSSMNDPWANALRIVLDNGPLA